MIKTYDIMSATMVGCLQYITNRENRENRTWFEALGDLEIFFWDKLKKMQNQVGQKSWL